MMKYTFLIFSLGFLVAEGARFGLLRVDPLHRKHNTVSSHHTGGGGLFLEEDAIAAFNELFEVAVISMSYAPSFSFPPLATQTPTPVPKQTVSPTTTSPTTVPVVPTLPPTLPQTDAVPSKPTSAPSSAPTAAVLETASPSVLPQSTIEPTNDVVIPAITGRPTTASPATASATSAPASAPTSGPTSPPASVPTSGPTSPPTSAPSSTVGLQASASRGGQGQGGNDGRSAEETTMIAVLVLAGACVLAALVARKVYTSTDRSYVPSDCSYADASTVQHTNDPLLATPQEQDLVNVEI